MIEIKAIGCRIPFKCHWKAEKGAQFRRSDLENGARETSKDGPETSKMMATKAPKQRQQSQSQEPHVQYGDLDQRYGKIGISAVAGAVGHKGERRKQAASKRPYIQNDSD